MIDQSWQWKLINDYHQNTSRNTNPISSTTINSTNTSTTSSVNSTTIVDITNMSNSFPGYPHLATADVARLLRSAPMNISNLSANSSIIDLTADTTTGNITISNIKNKRY